MGGTKTAPSPFDTNYRLAIPRRLLNLVEYSSLRFARTTSDQLLGLRLQTTERSSNNSVACSVLRGTTRTPVFFPFAPQSLLQQLVTYSPATPSATAPLLQQPRLTLLANDWLPSNAKTESSNSSKIQFSIVGVKFFGVKKKLCPKKNVPHWSQTCSL